MEASPIKLNWKVEMSEEFYRIKRLPPYVIAEVNAMRAAARQAGEDIIDLGMGNPDLPPPQHVIDKLCEVARNRSSAMERREWARVVAQQVGERCALMPQIVFVGSGALPRTTSGKIRRQAARAAYQAGEIKALVEGEM